MPPRSSRGSVNAFVVELASISRLLWTLVLLRGSPGTEHRQSNRVSKDICNFNSIPQYTQPPRYLAQCNTACSEASYCPQLRDRFCIIALSSSICFPIFLYVRHGIKLSCVFQLLKQMIWGEIKSSPYRVQSSLMALPPYTTRIISQMRSIRAASELHDGMALGDFAKYCNCRTPYFS